MEEQELRINALIKAISEQREAAYNLLAKSNADLHVLNAKITVLSTQNADLQKQLEELNSQNIGLKLAVENLNTQLEEFTKPEVPKAPEVSVVNYEENKKDTKIPAKVVNTR